MNQQSGKGTQMCKRSLLPEVTESEVSLWVWDCICPGFQKKRDNFWRWRCVCGGNMGQVRGAEEKLQLMVLQ